MIGAWSRARSGRHRAALTAAILLVLMASSLVTAHARGDAEAREDAARSSSNDDDADPPDPRVALTPASTSLGPLVAIDADEEPPEGVLKPPPEPRLMVALPLVVGAWTRTTINFQNPDDRAKTDKWLPEIILGLAVGGRVHKYFGLAAGLVGVAVARAPDAYGAATGRIADFLVVSQFEPVSWFNVWLGHMAVPSDRSGLSGPFFMAAWKYPGTVLPGAPRIGPKTGSFAGLSANNGGTIWGDLGAGRFKYYVGTYLSDPRGDPVYIGRLNVNFLEREPGFFSNSGYYGRRGDILSLGAAGQYQRNGSSYVLPRSVPPTTVRSDYLGFNVDLLFEKRLGARGGVLDLEGAFYVYDGKYERFNRAWFGLVSYLIPVTVGIGKLQPLVRVQQARDTHLGTAPSEIVTAIDAQVGYLIRGNKVRAAFGYTRHVNQQSLAGNNLWFGLQLMK